MKILKNSNMMLDAQNRTDTNQKRERFSYGFNFS